MIRVEWCRASWLGLIVLQPVWLLWLAPPELFHPGFALAVWMGPLVLAAPWVLMLRPRGLVVGGIILLFHFLFGVTEAWASPEARAPALVQVGLVTVYCLGLPGLPRRRPGPGE